MATSSYSPVSEALDGFISRPAVSIALHYNEMFDVHLRLLFSALPLGCAAAWAASNPAAKISAAPGTLVRWSAPGTTRCSMKGRSWAAVKDTCYYPVDLQQNPGILPIARSGSGHSTFARIVVEAFDFGTEEITLPDIPQANPSANDLKRDARDRGLLSKVWNRKEGPAKFTLPLGSPARPLPKGQSFGV